MDPASTSFILGYHGCDQRVADRVFAGKQFLKPSHNNYDWLGDGIYFWEHNAPRAFQFSCEVRDRQLATNKITKPAVVGAIIDLGFCLNLLDSSAIATLGRAYEDMVQSLQETGAPLPRNSSGADLLLRRLDCAVVRFLHKAREAEGEEPFDTVRAAFVEGGRLYENAGFAAKNHIQICVRNLACIKGFFRPLDARGKPMVFG